MTAAVIDTTLGELLCPSQVNTFLSCPAKWHFRYAIGLKEPATGSLALGTAFHAAMAANFRQKTETKHDLPTECETSFPRRSRSRRQTRSFVMRRIRWH